MAALPDEAKTEVWWEVACIAATAEERRQGRRLGDHYRGRERGITSLAWQQRRGRRTKARKAVAEAKNEIWRRHCDEAKSEGLRAYEDQKRNESEDEGC